MRGDADYEDRRVSLPFVVLTAGFYLGPTSARLSYDNINQFYRVEPFDGDATAPLLQSNLLNVGPDGHVCLGRSFDTNDDTWQSICSRLQRAFFAIGFNMDLGDNFGYRATQIGDPRIASIVAWEEATRDDPLFALNVRWQQSDYTIAKLEREFLCESDPVTALSMRELAAAVSSFRTEGTT